MGGGARGLTLGCTTEFASIQVFGGPICRSAPAPHNIGCPESKWTHAVISKRSKLEMCSWFHFKDQVISYRLRQYLSIRTKINQVTTAFVEGVRKPPTGFLRKKFLP